jgi:hypothetical protein
MVECSLRDVPEFTGYTGKTRHGRYHGSNFWDVPDFGSKRWVVGVYIDLDFSAVTEGMTEDRLLEECVNFLNVPPPRRKYQKKKSQPRYGILSPYRAKIVEVNGRKCLSALVVTSDRKNKMFWSEGNNVPTRKRN